MGLLGKPILGLLEKILFVVAVICQMLEDPGRAKAHGYRPWLIWFYHKSSGPGSESILTFSLVPFSDFIQALHISLKTSQQTSKRQRSAALRGHLSS
jgi:hypothetical protein